MFFCGKCLAFYVLKTDTDTHMRLHKEQGFQIGFPKKIIKMYRLKPCNKYINNSKCREKFQIYLEISLEFLSDYLQYWSNFRALSISLFSVL